jgi:hypothetical protein
MTTQDYFQPKNILFIKDYKFEDGGQSKDKILIVLYVDTQKVYLIQSLVTSQQKIPDDRVHHGCTNSTDDMFSFYQFEKTRVVGTYPDGSDFGFEENTFIYFQFNVKQLLLAKYEQLLADKTKLLAILSDEEYQRLIKCLKKSRVVPKKIKAQFEGNEE